MADSHIVVIGHDHECTGVHGKETIREEHLKETGKEAEGPKVKSEDDQHRGDNSEAEHNVQ